jgi:hypothetical protein
VSDVCGDCSLVHEGGGPDAGEVVHQVQLCWSSFLDRHQCDAPTLCLPGRGHGDQAKRDGPHFEEKCTGCGLRQACLRAIRLDEEKKKAWKCDFCGGPRRFFVVSAMRWGWWFGNTQEYGMVGREGLRVDLTEAVLNEPTAVCGAVIGDGI